MSLLVGPKELATYLGFTQSWIHQLVKHHGYPGPVKGKYDVPAWIAKMKSDYEDRIKRAKDKGVSELKRQNEEWDLKIKKFDFERRQGLMAPLTLIKDLWSRVMMTIQGRHQHMGTRIAAHFQGETARRVKQLVDKENHEIDAELARGYDIRYPGMAGAGRPDPGSAAAAQTERAPKAKRLGGRKKISKHRVRARR